MKHRLIRLLGMFAVLAQMVVGAALADTISGTVQNNTGNGTNRVYVVVMDPSGTNSTGFGTSIATIPAGSSSGFTVRGVPSGTYKVAAFMDVQNTGSLHINDPATGTGSFSLNGNQDVGALTLAAVSPTTAPNTVSKVNVVATTGGALVVWKGPKGPYGGSGPDAELADSYTIYWGTGANPGHGTTPAGSKPAIPATGGDYHVFVSGVSGSLYFTVKTANSKSTAYTSTNSPVTIAAPTGNATVTGRVYSAGIAKSASTPLYIALQGNNNGGFYIAEIPSPADSQSWSISGVQPDSYSLYVILDLANDGFSNVYGYATGPGMNGNVPSPSLTVPTGATAAVAPDITLTASNSITVVSTTNSDNSWYNLQFTSFSGLKRPVSATVNSGPNLSGPIDLGLSLGTNHGASFGGNGSQTSSSAKPGVGDTYSVTVGYSDGTSDALSPRVTGVVTSLPNPVYPVGETTDIVTNSSLFAWQAPGTLPPGYFSYVFWVDDSSYDFIWSPSNNSALPSTQLSVPYNSDGSATQSTLTSGTYYYGMNVVDGFGNQGMSNITFSPQAGGPAVSGFTPSAGGGAGTAVTVSGSGFTGASAVTFAGVTALFTVQNDSTITTTVPPGAPVGPITVTAGGITTASSTPFPATITFTGGVQNNATPAVAISGATVTLVNSDPAVSATTNGSGNFTITVPSGVPYSFRIHGGGSYRDTLTPIMASNANQNSTSTPYKLFTDGDLPASVADKGLIYSRVKDWDSGVNLGGAVVTARSFLRSGALYPVSYTGGGAATAADGVFYVPNVDEGDYVAVSATLPDYFVQPRTYATHTGVVSSGKVNATPLPVVAATPSGGIILPATSIALAVSNPVAGGAYTLWYTTDGSDPTVSVGSRTRYTSPLTLPLGDQTLKFYAVNTSRNVAGPVATSSYTVTTVDPATLPGAPGIGTVTRGNGQVTVNFTPPASDGGSPITSYTAISSPDGKTATGGGSPLTVTGLTNGTSYTFTVKATNGNGTGPASAPSASVTPATVPGKPSIGAATAGFGQASVAFSPPGSDGGSPITSYTATSSPGGISATGSASPIVVPGLANGTPYTFTVTATNAVGTGPASDGSNSVTPLSPFTWTVKSSTANASFKGGKGTISFTVTGNGTSAAVVASSSDSWLSIVAPATVALKKGKGNGKVSWTALPNPASMARSATITIGTATVTVTQAAAPCLVKLTPTKISLANGGGAVSVAVAAPEACNWSVSSGTATWITPTPLSGTGSGTVTLDVAPYTPGKSRSGKVTVTTPVKSASVTVKQSK